MRILLVDDHTDTRTIYGAVLGSTGHSVVGVATIAAAVAAADAERFDLLVSDLLLPDGTGYDLMRHLVARYGMRGIALSGCHRQEDIDRCYAAGFSRHLAKPVDISHLLDVVTAYAALPGTGAPEMPVVNAASTDAQASGDSVAV